MPLTWNTPLLSLYWYGGVPPLPVTVNEPVELPKQATFIRFVAEADKVAAGPVIMTLVVAMQPFTSATVTLYVPESRLVAVCVVWEGTVLHAKVYGAVPFPTVTVALPLFPLKQLVGIVLTVSAIAGAFFTETI